MDGFTYQSYKNTEELDDISVGHRVEPTHQGVQSSNECRDDDGRMHIHINDHTDGGSWKETNK